MEQDRVYEWIRNLCACAGENDSYAKEFLEKLEADEEIYEEFVYYMEHGTFACRAKVQGYRQLM